jgi:hypothetical protein
MAKRSQKSDSGSLASQAIMPRSLSRRGRRARPGPPAPPGGRGQSLSDGPPAGDSRPPVTVTVRLRVTPAMIRPRRRRQCDSESGPGLALSDSDSDAGAVRLFLSVADHGESGAVNTTRNNLNLDLSLAAPGGEGGRGNHAGRPSRSGRRAGELPSQKLPFSDSVTVTGSHGGPAGLGGPGAAPPAGRAARPESGPPAGSCSVSVPVGQPAGAPTVTVPVTRKHKH